MIEIYCEHGPLDGQIQLVEAGAAEFTYYPEFGGKYELWAGRVYLGTVPPMTHYYRIGKLRDNRPIFRARKAPPPRSNNMNYKTLQPAPTLGELQQRIAEAIELVGADERWLGWDDGSIIIQPDDKETICIPNRTQDCGHTKADCEKKFSNLEGMGWPPKRDDNGEMIIPGSIRFAKKG